MDPATTAARHPGSQPGSSGPGTERAGEGTGPGVGQRYCDQVTFGLTGDYDTIPDLEARAGG